VSVDTIQHRARVAGRWYFVMSLIALPGLAILPGKLMVPGDAAASAAHVRAAEMLLRLLVASELAHQALCVYLVMALYRLFVSVNRDHARMMVILGALVSVPVMFANAVFELAALYLARGGGSLAVFPPAQLDALSYLFLRLHSNGVSVASIFWGLWLFPFGLLVLRSGFIPRVFGGLLIVAGAAYVVDVAAWLLLPAQAHAVGQVTGLLEIAEVPIIFWLLIWGARGPGVTEPIPA